MHKKLNPSLFNPVSTEKVQSQAPSHNQQMGLPIVPPQVTGALEAHKLFEELQSLKTKMRTYDSQLEVLRNQMSEFVRTLDQRFERVSQALSRLEKAVHNQSRDAETKIKQVREKIQSHGFEEAKIEGLIERQTVIIRNFENRVAALQKIVNDKELLNMKFAEALRQSQKR